MKTRYFHLLILLFILLSLVSCGGSSDFKDLRTQLSKLEQATSDTKKYVWPQPVAVQYQKGVSRTPFEESDKPKQTGVTTNGDQPLLMYQLNLLRFIGTVTKNDRTIAYILTPDNKVYEVGIGDTIGNHNGKIASITPSRLEVREQSSEEGQAEGQRIITLQLKEEN